MSARQIENALRLYDARRALGIPGGRALYSTAADLARALDVTVTRETARRMIVAALVERANIGTRTETGAF